MVKILSHPKGCVWLEELQKVLPSCELGWVSFPTEQTLGARVPEGGETGRPPQSSHVGTASLVVVRLLNRVPVD